ncbi:DsbA family protein [Micromonospora sp. NBC_01796]|uniref:DsbA family protein n=1 Tax=Micromonospora sp. NBC_01796 TaxID=2975987 RepID=UPI002DD7EBCD|nr:thioredoxin domain-containing protein [Micromonospora sp. NBC_01796]WSA88423.1 DsbA family protein [Micromonospora sp. NBC_01796]
MTRNVKTSLVIVAVVAAVIMAAALADGPATPGGQGPQVTDTANPALVRPDSHRLSTATDGKVTVVEFLDFECEACGATYPTVEKIRAAYADRITFVVRYFPVASHPNAELAARAVEAAARQGKFEAMYGLMFQRQTQWGHQDGKPQTDTFAGYARELGLDLDRFALDLQDPEVAERVAADQRDGATLGVRGTPTFFINGTPIDGLPDHATFVALLDEELAR